MSPAKKRFILKFFKQNSNFPLNISKALLEELSILKKRLNNRPLFYELLYLLFIYDPNLTQLLIQNQQKQKVALLFTYGKAYSNILATFLQKTFKNLSVEVLDYQQTTPSSLALDAYDYCLTNLPTLTFKQNRCLLLDIYPSDQEIYYLTQLFQSSSFIH